MRSIPGIVDFSRPGLRGAHKRKVPASLGLTWHHEANRQGVMHDGFLKFD